MFDFLDIQSLLFRIPALLVALAFHEYAHAVVSDSLGDPTPRMMGRLTVNPMAHFDVMGTLLLVLCGFGWAKPVPINPRYYKNYKSGVIKVSLAGVGANFLIAFISALLVTILMTMGWLDPYSYQFINWMIIYNIWFGLFNLIPLPPLDGSRVLSMILPGDLAYKYDNFNERYSFIILMLLVFSGMAGRILGPLYGLVQGLFYTIAYTVNPLFWDLFH